MSKITEKQYYLNNLETNPVLKAHIFALAMYNAIIKQNQLQNIRRIEAEELAESEDLLRQYKEQKAARAKLAHPKTGLTYNTFQKKNSEAKYKSTFFFQQTQQKTSKTPPETLLRNINADIVAYSNEHQPEMHLSNQQLYNNLVEINEIQTAFLPSNNSAYTNSTYNNSTFNNILLTVVINTIKSTIKSAGYSIISTTTDKAVTRVIKTVSPRLAKSLPIAGTILNTVELGYMLFKVEPLENKMNALADIGIACVATAAGQAIIPIPLLGAFIGNIAGTAIIELKNAYTEPT